MNSANMHECEEGVLTCSLAFLFYILIPDFPEEATWLSADEKAVIDARLKEDVGNSGIREPMTFKRAVNVIKDCAVSPVEYMYLRADIHCRQGDPCRPDVFWPHCAGI